ncbi:MAG: efflux RND transporter permease subunit [Bacteroidales bacterium]|nr:efflux RND transporter permease subunit [Bacteroidales bacterium]
MMLSDLALKRPVAASVASLLIILLGIVGFTFLGVRLYPSIDPPMISVMTNYTGANAEIIESQITEPLEKSINGIEGIKSISSRSAVGVSFISVEFELGSDLEKAANDVRDKVSQAMRQLPQDIDAPPTVTKADADNEPIIMLSVLSSKMTAIELSDYTENVLLEKLQTINGVSSVSIWGQQKPAMRLWLDPAKLVANNLTAVDVHNAIRRENIEKPGGKIRGHSTELIVKTYGRLETEEDFNNLIVKNDGTRIIRFSDIGEASIGAQNEESELTFNGMTAANLAIIPLPGANDINIADEFYKRLEDIKQTLPDGMELIVARDKSIFVRQSVQDVGQTLVIAIVLVVLIIFLFFRNWIIALRPLIDIPVSLIGTLFVMYIFGYSINVLTLMGIILATGLVVDDGIVVTENIFKRVEAGMDRWKAAAEGTREIFFAVVSTSLTLAIVFIPVIFLEGFTGRLFREFGVVVASAVLISAFVSLTLTPVLNVFLGGTKSHHSRFYLATEPFFQGMERTYRRILSFFFKFKWTAIAILVICLAIIVALFYSLKSELAPLEDHSFVRLSITTPEGTDYELTKNIMGDFGESLIEDFPEIENLMVRSGGGFWGSGSNSGSIMMYLTDPKHRKRTQQEIFNEVSKKTAQVSAARIIPGQEPTIATSTSRGLPIQLVIQNLDLEKIKEILPVFLEEASNSPVFSSVDVDLKFNKPEINIVVDKLKANSLGVSEKDVSDVLNYALSGSRYDYFLRNNKQYFVIGQVMRENRDDPADISALYVRSSTGQMISLDNLIKMEENSNPPTLYHFNRYKSAKISANYAEGYTQGEGIAEMQRIAADLLDNTFQTELAGGSRDFAESSSNISFALVLALLLIYLILAAQFESFRDPFIIMLTVPTAVAGALLSLHIFGHTLNIFSQIGMLLLIGIVTKNGILIVDFANRKQIEGKPKRVAAFEAAVERFRPIVMTSLATIFGALPIALALGAGAQSRIPLGVVVVGGLLFSMILTLFVIPVMYVYMSGEKKAKPKFF